MEALPILSVAEAEEEGSEEREEAEEMAMERVSAMHTPSTMVLRNGVGLVTATPRLPAVIPVFF